tara:strand:- start:423312 stop:425384 length:2073 start_codon:yes stop_codon:yes gene_type:complete
MSLLNASLALGALAFAIPLIIHLIFRSQFKIVDWGAMYLLTEAVVAKRRRFQWNDLLLLLVRCAIPILLAFCLARPVITHWNALPGDEPQSFVIVIDDSRSMTASEPNEVVRFEKAKQELNQFLSQQSRRDEVILLTSSRADEPASKMGVHQAVAKINTLVADSGPVDVGRLVQAGAEAAESASNPHRHVVIVSDFQSNIVDDAAIESVDVTKAAVRSHPLPPAFSFLNIAQQTEKLKNLSVDSVGVDAPAIVTERKTPFDAKIRNSSDFAVRNLRVIWSIDDEVVRTVSIEAEPRSTSIARAMLRFADEGPHQVSVVIEHDDALLADNRRELSVEVLNQVNVLLVSGDPSSKPLQGETDFLAIALSPFSFNTADRPDPIRTDVVSAAIFKRLVRDRKSDLSNTHVVVLANVNEVDPDVRSHLASFVADGGALAIFDGDRLNPSTFNQDWGVADDNLQSGPMRLPVVMGEVHGRSTRRGDDRGNSSPFRIGQINPQYLPWALVADDQQSAIRRIDVQSYRKLTHRDPETADGRDASNSTTILELNNGDPLVVLAPFGRGKIAQFAIPCDADWSTLPLRPVFVPMMHQLMMDLAGHSQDQPDDIDGIPASESELRDVNPQRLRALADALGGGVFQDAVSFQAADQTRRFGREVWRWLLLALLAALVMEVLLQQRRWRVPKSTSPQRSAVTT